MLLEFRAQQTACFDPKVVILAIFLRITVYKGKLLNLKYFTRNYWLWFRRKIFHVMLPLRKIWWGKKNQKNHLKLVEYFLKLKKIKPNKSLLTNWRNRHYWNSSAINQNIRDEKSSLFCHPPAPSYPALDCLCPVLSCQTFAKQPAVLGLSHCLGGTELYFFCNKMNVSVRLVETLMSKSHHVSLSHLE